MKHFYKSFLVLALLVMGTISMSAAKMVKITLVFDQDGSQEVILNCPNGVMPKAIPEDFKPETIKWKKVGDQRVQYAFVGWTKDANSRTLDAEDNTKVFVAGMTPASGTAVTEGMKLYSLYVRTPEKTSQEDGDYVDYVTTNAAGWASYTNRYNCNMKFPDDLKAFVVEQIYDPSHIRMKRVSAISRDNGVFVLGTPKTKYKLTSVVAALSTSDKAAQEINKIVGVPGGETITLLAKDADTKPAYIVATAYDENGVGYPGLYRVTSDQDIESPRAYLAITVGDPEEGYDVLLDTYYPESGAKPIYKFEIVEDTDDATAVESVDIDNVSKASSVLYNLAGQQVTGSYKGVVIDANGNKYMNK